MAKVLGGFGQLILLQKLAVPIATFEEIFIQVNASQTVANHLNNCKIESPIPKGISYIYSSQFE